ncbi:MAG TPA: recombinase family protein [Patescibacteria group bacterium]|nr:recombinase family protein [Patescibacteria group bacterium]
MENKFKIRAVIYARVSTKEQAEDKISIPSQINDSRKTIAERGWELVHEPYADEGISGHLLEERRGLQSLLQDARQHAFDLVVVKDFDRFARNRAAATIVREELKELFIQTYALNTPVEPKDPNKYDPTDDDLAIMVEGFSDANSEIERNKIRRRMMMGKVAVAKSGKIPNNVPYGYKIIRSIDDHGKVHREIIVDEEQAKNVRWIFDQYINGKGALNIAFQLTEKGIKPIRGQFWRAQAIKYILQNRTYTGKVLWGWRHAEYKKNQQRKLRGHKGIIENGEHKAIIPEPTFELAQKEKKIRGSSQKGRAQLSRGLLTGIAKCIRCKSGVTYLTRHHKRKKKNPKWNDTTTHEYLCGGYKYSGICQRRVMSATRLEEFVLNQIRNLINNPLIREKLIFDRSVNISEGFEDDYKHAAKMLNDIQRRRGRVKEAFEAGIDSLEVYGANIRRLDDEESKYHAVADDYQIRIQKFNERREELEKFTKSLEDFNTLWDNADFQEKKHFLRTILKEVRAGNGKIEIDFRL